MANNELTHKERIRRILEGRDIDRPAISVWRHFYDRENNRDDLVASMIAFQREFDWDFIKINPRASYFIEDWGAVFKYSRDPMVKPTMTGVPIKSKSDWSRIKPLDSKVGVLGEILSATSEIVKQMKSEIHIVQTIFSPLSIAGDLVESDSKFIELLRNGRVELHSALESITKTFIMFVNELMTTGISGIFFATTEWASRSFLTEEEYLEFGRPYDLEVLRAAGGAEFNIVHVCNKNNMLAIFRDYPAQILSWNPFDEGNFSIHQAAQIVDKVLLAGIDHIKTLRTGSPAEVKQQIESSLAEVPPGRLIIGPGCAAKTGTSYENLMAASTTAKGWKR